MSGGRPHQVVVLVLPGVLPIDLGIPAQVFGTDPHYAMTVCADPSAGPVHSDGFTVSVSAGLEALRNADTVVVPGFRDPHAPISDTAVQAIRAAHACGTRLVSICTGAFALAASGLLDERPATTHWGQADLLQRLYPRIDVQANRLFVDDGDVLTSAGVTAGLDLCLHIIRNDHGAAAANTRARALVAPPHRSGNQAQFIERFRPSADGEKLALIRAWMLDNLTHRQSVDDLAQRAHMSRRTFLRHFRQETHTSPMAWLAAARIDFARELLEATATPVEQVAGRSGLGSPAAFRAAFHRHVGTSPTAYRAMFRVKTAETRKSPAR